MVREQEPRRAAERYASPPPVAVGDECTLVVESLGEGGDGIAMVGEYVVIVPLALPGEKVRVRITSAARKHGRADLLEVLRRSEDRVEPLCGHFGECGGCQLQHLSYEKQKAHKEALVERALRHALGSSAPKAAPMRAPEEPWGQRTKIALHLRERDGRLEAGLFARRSRELVAIRECPASDARGLAHALAAVDELDRARVSTWVPWTDVGEARAIVVRQGTSDAQTVLSLRREPRALAEITRSLAERGGTSVVVNLNSGPAEQLLGGPIRVVSGKERVAVAISGIEYLCSPGAFFQTSAWGAAFLVEAVRRLVAPPRSARVLDLYCGGGLLGLALADRVDSVLGIEESFVSCGDAVATAAHNRLANARFLRGPVEELLASVPKRPRPYAILLDPPRDGCTPGVLTRVAVLQPDKVLYVSCAPDALGRDLKELARHRYRPRAVEPFDMFPQTARVETVVLLEPW